MVLREKLKSIKMAKAERVREELGKVVSGSELVRIALNGVTKPWVVFVEAIVFRENLPS